MPQAAYAFTMPWSCARVVIAHLTRACCQQGQATAALQRLMQALPEGVVACTIYETPQGLRLTRCELDQQPVVLDLPWACADQVLAIRFLPTSTGTAESLV